MRTLTIALLSIITTICFGQKEIDQKFNVEIDHIDSILIPSSYNYKIKRDSLAKKYSNWHQRSRSLEEYLLKEDNPGIVRDKNDLIEVTLVNGQVIKLIPDRNFDETDYTFEGSFKQLKLLLFRVQMGEGNYYALIDQVNGKKTYLIGYPIFSPDKKFMAAINCDIEAQYSSNGFELFEITNRNFKRIWRYDPEVWGPLDLKWVDNSIMVSKNSIIDSSNDHFKSSFTRLKINHNVH